MKRETREGGSSLKFLLFERVGPMKSTASCVLGIALLLIGLLMMTSAQANGGTAVTQWEARNVMGSGCVGYSEQQNICAAACGTGYGRRIVEGGDGGSMDDATPCGTGQCNEPQSYSGTCSDS